MMSTLSCISLVISQLKKISHHLAIKTFRTLVKKKKKDIPYFKIIQKIKGVKMNWVCMTNPLVHNYSWNGTSHLTTLKNVFHKVIIGIIYNYSVHSDFT